MATGRKAKTKDIGLEEIGVELDEKGGVKVHCHITLSMPGAPCMQKCVAKGRHHRSSLPAIPLMCSMFSRARQGNAPH